MISGQWATSFYGRVIQIAWPFFNKGSQERQGLVELHKVVMGPSFLFIHSENKSGHGAIVSFRSLSDRMT